MENDSIRSAGEMTLVDIWIDGKLRSISVAREAIAKLRQAPPGGALSDEECREFVRTRLALVAATAKDRLRSDPTIEAVTITAEQVGAGEDGNLADRRKTDRRKRERRAPGQPGGRIGDRRQVDRRKTDRRKASRKPPEKAS